MQTGILRNLPIAEYHAADCVSSTRLMDLRPSPAFFHMRHVAKTLAAKICKEFDVGNGGHWLILEGRRALEARTVLQPETYETDKGERKPWTYAANYCKAWRITNALGKVVLTAGDFATIDRMAAAVGENPDAMALLTGGESEVTFRVQHPAFSVQCRADHWHAPNTTMGHVCVDLKTCDSIERFKADYWKLRYFARAAFYREVMTDVTEYTPDFYFVVCEKEPPHRCEVFQPSESDIELGRNEMLADLKTLRECIESGVWPNSRPGIQPIELSSWQRKLSEDRGAGLFEEAGAL